MSKPNKSTSGDSGTSDGTSQFINPADSIGDGNRDGNIRDASGCVFDPTIHASPDSFNSDGNFRKKRGRKSGSGGTKSRSQIRGDIKESADFLARGLLIFHTSIAAMTKTPELVLEEEEAKGLAESGLTLASMYDIRPDPKLEAAILFAGQVGLIYGTRFVAIRARKSQEKEERRKNTAGVYNADGSPAGTTEYSSGPVEAEWPFNPNPIN